MINLVKSFYHNKKKIKILPKTINAIIRPEKEIKNRIIENKDQIFSLLEIKDFSLLDAIFFNKKQSICYLKNSPKKLEKSFLPTNNKILYNIRTHYNNWTDILHVKIKHCKILVQPKLTCTFNAIPIKIVIQLFVICYYNLNIYLRDPMFNNWSSLVAE